MLSNFLTTSIHTLTPESCFQLADYFDAQAAELRRTGEEKEQDFRNKKEDFLDKIEEQKELLLAGKMALDLVGQGVQKTVACGRAATLFHQSFIVVEANFMQQYRMKKITDRETRKEKALALNAKGLSIRRIAAELGCSRTTILNDLRSL